MTREPGELLKHLSELRRLIERLDLLRTQLSRSRDAASHNAAVSQLDELLTVVSKVLPQAAAVRGAGPMPLTGAGVSSVTARKRGRVLSSSLLALRDDLLAALLPKNLSEIPAETRSEVLPLLIVPEADGYHVARRSMTYLGAWESLLKQEFGGPKAGLLPPLPLQRDNPSGLVRFVDVETLLGAVGALRSREEMQAPVAGGHNSQTPTMRPESTDVAIVCALHTPELSKLIEFAGDGLDWNEKAGAVEDPHTYHTTRLKTDRGTHVSLVAAAPIHMGLSSSAVLATKMILRFRPKLVMMVGIAAGIEKTGREYGDVLAAEKTFDYGSGKITRDDDRKLRFLPDHNPLSVDIWILDRLKTVKSKLADRISESMRKRWPTAAPRGGQVAIHIGPLASGSAVVDDSEEILRIMEHWRKLVGVEMEAYAVHRACNDTLRRRPSFVCFKSICDFGHNKDDSYRDYAAYTAAECALAFLRMEWEHLQLGASDNDGADLEDP